MKYFVAIIVVLCAADKASCVRRAVCEKNKPLCQFWLEVEPKLSMTKGFMRVMPYNGGLYSFSDPSKTLLPKDEVADIVTIDGVYARLVISVNKSFPGPELVVYEGQEVEVFVTNKMHTDSITIHFHGMHQKGTPWMDGVGLVTQCPVLPEQTFKYRFTATPKGTHWYHAHIGDQRSIGLYGAFIVRRRNEPLPLANEHIIVLQDWNHDMDPETAYLKMLHGMFDCEENAKKCSRISTTESVEGGQFSRFEFHSGLINGQGRFYYDPTKPLLNNGAPLQVFTVDKGKTYRFRVISAATLYPFRLYIAQHNLTVVASDGHEIEPRVVQSIILQTGERVDFTITPTLAVKKYMIIAESLEVNRNHVAEAILRYNNSPVGGVPVSTLVACNPCLVFNCPFVNYPPNRNRECILMEDARSNEQNVTGASIEGEPDKEFFLNFAFPGEPGDTPGSVNGRQYASPSVAALVQPKEVFTGPACDKVECGTQKICTCHYTIDLDDGDLVQMVFSNMGNGRGYAHPVHLHGHSFYVLKMGFPDYNPNGTIIGPDNQDIECGGSYCNSAAWRENKEPALNFDKPPLKDTIVVPSGGYVVIRFRADNPGLWFLHCHIDLHNTNGMAMLVNETFNMQPTAPKSFPRCRSYVDDIDRESAYVCGCPMTGSWTWMVISLGILSTTWIL
ncbi:laccase-1-like [Gigantopelta aegis]|uniref:laccase-1-like n=1 Tax=Gigantopelta aegis TaxID=1735272 RepID=UPI001B88D984|nr:laccase-1-like [Gigantopelta aegis]